MVGGVVDCWASPQLAQIKDFGACLTGYSPWICKQITQVMIVVFGFMLRHQPLKKTNKGKCGHYHKVVFHTSSDHG